MDRLALRLVSGESHPHEVALDDGELLLGSTAAAGVRARHAAQLEFVRALHDEHLQPAAALDLQRDRTVEL